MDLKIKDVADLLNVSETTIRRWLVDGKIPAYRINHQYRFSRIEIEDWVLKQKLGNLRQDAPSAVFNGKNLHTETPEEKGETSPGTRGRKQFSLYRAINIGGVFTDVPGNTKEEVICATMKMLAKTLSLDADVLTELLLDRESLMPTALSNGIGVPHTRDFLLKSHQDVVAVAFPKKPIEYGALDGLPVHSMFFLFASDDKSHLHLLAKIAHLSSDDSTLELLQSRPEKTRLLPHIKDWEIGLESRGIN